MAISKRKMAIIGVGSVGAVTAYTLLMNQVCDELLLMDLNERKLMGEILDLQHSLEFVNSNMKITRGTYEDCKDVDILIITASASGRNCRSRLELLEKNVTVMKSIVEPVMASGFHGIIIVVSNPVDLMAYYVHKISGLPKNHVIGTGTFLDTIRLKRILAEKIDVDSKSINAYVLGEHGDSQMIAWSHANIGGKLLSQYVRDNRLDLDCDELQKQVRDIGNQVYYAKGTTSYGIAGAVLGITKAIIYNQNLIMPVSTLLEGEYGEKDVFVSVPVILNADGVKGIGELHLNEEELVLLRKSIKILKKETTVCDLVHRNCLENGVEKEQSEEVLQLTYNELNNEEKKVYRFVSVYQKLLNQHNSYGTDITLTVVEAHTLSEIDDTPGITVTQLAQHWYKTLGAISQTIRKLEEKGLIYKKQDKNNEKIMHLFVTDSGKQLSSSYKAYDIERIKSVHEELSVGYTEEELSGFYNILETYTDYVVQRGNEKTKKS